MSEKSPSLYCFWHYLFWFLSTEMLGIDARLKSVYKYFARTIATFSFKLSHEQFCDSRIRGFIMKSATFTFIFLIWIGVEVTANTTKRSSHMCPVKRKFTKRILIEHPVNITKPCIGNRSKQCQFTEFKKKYITIPDVSIQNIIKKFKKIVSHYIVDYDYSYYNF